MQIFEWKFFNTLKYNNRFIISVLIMIRRLTSDHLFCDAPKAFFKASTSLLNLNIVDSLVFCFAGDDIAVTEKIISSFGVAVRSECLGLVTEPDGSADRAEGDALGVGVDVTDNLDPPLWFPEEEDGVWDLRGEYCCSNPLPTLECFSLFRFDDGGLGGNPPPIPTGSFDFDDSFSSKWTEWGEADEFIPVSQISSSNASASKINLYYYNWTNARNNKYIIFQVSLVFLDINFLRPKKELYKMAW